MSSLMTYNDVMTELGNGRRSRIHLLLGNGFSISCDSCFAYGNLYQLASSDFSDHIKGLFALTGENNFEGVLRMIDNSAEVAEIYDSRFLADQLKNDWIIVRESLVTSLVNTHMVNTTALADEKKEACGKFLRPYHNVFTTNYDLLLYWVEMNNQGLQGNDGFRSDEQNPEADYVVFTERAGVVKSIFYLHGALHIYRKDGQLRKHTWCRTNTPLIDGIRKGFEFSQYPLFVAEGSAEKKMQQILGDPYMDYCLGKLGRIENAVVVFGLSFGDSDDHILKTIRHNHKVKSLYIGLFGDETLPNNVRIKSKFASIVAERENTNWPLTVSYYDSSTATVWG